MPANPTRPRWPAAHGLAIALLLLGLALRATALFDLPPGLTHDEAGHGHDAVYVLRGVTPLYFPVGYGREPLFDYLNAGFVALLGPTVATLRLSAFFWGALTLAVTYAAARKLFGPSVALWALAFMVVGFWSLATSRQILRSAMLPVYIGLAVLFYTPHPATPRRHWLATLGLGLSLGAALYTYLPARILWLMFLPPLLVTFPRLHRPAWLSTLAGVALTWLLAAPLFLYLATHPATEARLAMLDAPLDALLAGDPGPMVANIFGTLAAFVIPGAGDTFLAYNLPGRPIFDPLTALLALLGLGALIWHWRKPTHTLALSWLALGLAASLITGPAALFTRAIGAQPLLYMLPALGLHTLTQRLAPNRRPWLTRAAALLVLLVGLHTGYDYFIRWGQSPDVRAAYQSTLVTALDALPPNTPALVGTVYPTVAHDAYIALLTHPELSPYLRFADTRFALCLPATDDFRVLTTTAVTPHPAFQLTLSSATLLPMRPTDLDPAAYLATIPPSAILTALPPLTPPPAAATFNNALTLVGSTWLADTTAPGGVAELLTVWRVNSAEVGPRVPPANQTDMLLFTHVLAPNGTILVQRDALDCPSWQWQPGDTIVQVHQFYLPPETPPGSYPTVLGLYDRASGLRARTPTAADTLPAPPLIIAAP